MEKLQAFTQLRHAVIAENVANIDTPGYKARHLDPKAFQRALAKAREERGGDNRKPFIVRSGQVDMTANGHLRVFPQTRPIQNILFHDGTTAGIEREMANLAENAMTHELAVELLKGRFDELAKAVRGRL